MKESLHGLNHERLLTINAGTRSQLRELDHSREQFGKTRWGTTMEFRPWNVALRRLAPSVARISVIAESAGYFLCTATA
jgi:hypothetical protein